MAIVTILLSCALGAIVGLVQLIFLGAGVGQAFLTYLAVSVLLPVAVIGASLIIALLRPALAGTEQLSQDAVETWQDWQTEEEMAEDRSVTEEPIRANEIIAARIEKRHTA